MKYLKVFEGFEDDLWEKIPRIEYDDLIGEECISMSEADRTNIKNLFKDECSTSNSQTSIELTLIDYKGVGITGLYPYYIQITVDRLVDYYFAVCIERIRGNSYHDHSYYKCDDILGLKNLLSSKNII